jgi:hypothetical protein
MAESREKKVDTSTFWFIIVPVSVLLLLGFFFYILFNVNSIQTASSKQVFQIVRKLKNSRL